MGATRKDVETVYYWINNIGRDLHFPFPRSEDARKALELELYPKMVGEGVHRDFAVEMSEYLEDLNPYGSIRFRFEDISDFQLSVRSHFISWILAHYQMDAFPKVSYFVMRKTIDDITITDEGAKLKFSITDSRDRFPLQLRLSKKQLFLLKPLLAHHDLSERLLEGSLSQLEQALKGTYCYVLKYMSDYCHVEHSIKYWTYSMMAPDAEDLCEAFMKSVQGGFLPGYHPERLPMPRMGRLPFLYSKTLTQRKRRVSKVGEFKLLAQNGKACLVLKKEIIGFIHQNRFEWFCKPSAELLQHVNRLLS